MNVLDYIIVALYFGAMIWLGLRFKRNTSGADYFLGGRSFGWFSLGMSTMATQLSAVSFVSAPAFVGLRAGGGMRWLSYELAVPLAMIPILTLIGPVLYRSGVVSVYSFLEDRFGRNARLLLSALFIVSRALSTGVTIYVVTLVLASLLRLPFWETTLILAGVTIVYALKGGLKAIVYSEVAQMLIKVMGILVIMIVALRYMGGVSVFLDNLDHRRLEVIDFGNTGLDGRQFGFWPMLLGGIFLYTSYYGTDQTQAQRILAARNPATVRQLLLFNGFLRFPIAFAYCFGGLILGTFALTHAAFRDSIPADKPDLMIPVFIAQYLPHGLIGLIVVALIAAWMSAYSSTLNSLTAVTMEDFIVPWLRIPPERYVARSKSVLLIWGVITIVFSFFAGRMAATAIEAINKIGSLTYGPILGVFLLALLPRVAPAAAVPAVLAGVGVNLSLWLFVPDVFWFWWNAIGGITTLAIGGILGVVLRRPPLEAQRPVLLVAPFPWRDVGLLGLYFVCILVFCLLLPRML